MVSEEAPRLTRVLHVPFHYFPEPVGGTEVYTASLVSHLRNLGVDAMVAAPGPRTERYQYDSAEVFRFGIDRQPRLETLYGQGDAIATQEFARILDECAPDIAHLHAMSPAVSEPLLGEIKRRSIPVVFTCHIPGITCPRGTLLEFGRSMCDGVWNAERCTACTLQERGLPETLAHALAYVPASVGTLLGRTGLGGRLVTSVRLRELQEIRRRSLEKFLFDVDRLVAVSQWLFDLLLRNGVSPEKLVLCRHGATQSGGDAQSRPHNNVLRLAFLGRPEAAKGLHVLLDAFARRPDLPVRLDAYLIVQGESDYVRRLSEFAARDRRVRLKPPVPNSAVVEILSTYDVLAVPSQWLETGPLVVYDAFLAGLPVIGSNRGGIAELVRHDVDGLLIEPDNAEAWASAIERLVHEPGLLKRLTDGVAHPRSMQAVAREMLQVYQQLQAQNAPGHC